MWSPTATQERAIGKMGRRNRGNPEAKKIEKPERNQTTIGIRHALVLRNAKRINGARARTMGPKKSQKPAFFRCPAAKKTNGIERRGLWLAEAPVSLAMLAMANEVTSCGESLAERKGKTGFPVQAKFRK